MQIVDYRYIKGTERRDKYIAIPELNRLKPSARQFIALASIDIVLSQPTAFLYIEGFSIAQSDCGLNPVDTKNYMPSLKAGSSYIAHEWVQSFKNKEHLVRLDLLSGTCAAGIQAVYEADRLLNEGKVKEVIIIGGERTTPDTIRLFKELGIRIMCGDGLVYMRLTKQEGGMQIVAPEWKFAYSQNPFSFTEESLNTLIPYYNVDYVKLHGTGTKSNTNAEAGLAKIATNVTYKDEIGHTQGVSALLETCMVIDDDSIEGNILVTANGVGGFYGAFSLLK